MAITIDGDSGVSGVNGSATTPALQGTDSNTGIVFGTDEVSIATGGSARATVDSSGRVLSGLSSAPGTVGGFSHVNIGGTSINANGAIGLYRNTASPSSGQGIGAISFANSDGNRGALIQALSGGTWGTNDYPGELAFSTTADGASSVSERLRIKSNGNVGIATNNPSAILEISGIPNANSTNEAFTIDRSDGTQLYSINYNQTTNTVEFQGNTKFFAFQNQASNAESMRITTDGSVMMGQTSVNLASAGFSYRNNSGDENAAITTSRTGGGGECLNLNRQSSDGNFITFYQASTVEGSISVSGSTVSYNGGHISRWSQLAGGAERIEILRGSVLSNLDEMCEWAYPAQDAVLYTEEDELPEGVSVGDIKTPARDAGTEDNEQLNRMKVSDIEGDANVAGVFMNWDDHDDTYDNDFYCAMTGDFVIRIAQGTTVARGDLLMSAGDGTAKPQDDDIVRSKTIAKVTSTTVSTTYSDGSYCVPCVLMAC